MESRSFMLRRIRECLAKADTKTVRLVYLFLRARL